MGLGIGMGHTIKYKEVPLEGLDLYYQPSQDGVEPFLVDGATTFSRGTTATYRDENGVIQTASIDQHRVQDSGLLMEESRTNSFTHSEDLTDASWTKTNATTSADAQSAPDNTTSSDKIVEDSSASSKHGVEQSLSTTAGNPQAFSVFGRADGRDWCYIETKDDGGNTHRSWINLSTGSEGTIDGQHRIQEIETNTNGHFRINLVASPSLSYAVNNIGLFTATGDGSATHNGDGSSGIDAWGFQWEKNSYSCTSYIPTSGSAVTRNEDTLELIHSQAYDSSLGVTLYTKASFHWPGGSGPNDKSILTLQDSGSNNLLEIATNSSGERIVSSTVSSTKETDVVASGASVNEDLEIILREQPSGFSSQFAVATGGDWDSDDWDNNDWLVEDPGPVTDVSLNNLSTNHSSPTWQKIVINGFNGELLAATVAEGDHQMADIRNLLR